MSTTKELKDVFKAAQEVTSLESSGSVMVCDNNGTPKKMSRDNLMRQDREIYRYRVVAGEERWIRIAKMSDYGSSAIVSISHVGFNGGWCFPITAMVCAPHAGSSVTMSVTSLVPKPQVVPGYSFPFSKMRITGNEGIKYIDILVSKYSVDHFLCVSLVCGIATSLVTPVENPAEMTATKEFSIDSILTAKWGGVNCFVSINYAILQKGGLRNEQNDRAYQLIAEEQDDGCCLLQINRIGSRLGFMRSGWNLSGVLNEFFKQPDRLVGDTRSFSRIRYDKAGAHNIWIASQKSGKSDQQVELFRNFLDRVPEESLNVTSERRATA